jgi:hypothetical protein
MLTPGWFLLPAEKIKFKVRIQWWLVLKKSLKTTKGNRNNWWTTFVRRIRYRKISILSTMSPPQCSNSSKSCSHKHMYENKQYCLLTTNWLEPIAFIRHKHTYSAVKFLSLPFAGCMIKGSYCIIIVGKSYYYFYSWELFFDLLSVQ